MDKTFYNAALFILSYMISYLRKIELNRVCTVSRIDLSFFYVVREYENSNVNDFYKLYIYEKDITFNRKKIFNWLKSD